ncbi:MAG: TfoX/Sxy family protein [Alphaproteobacteria bacterium]|jgi:TfoX/Sxy family transcriptional regulator of competence genes|nr:TfoX/Sxy family protein [Alphaproteobacteria bacterium]MDP6814143.1 TfoX/Sxy family protein [Alphaproteobacteria bacterium]
MAEPYLSDLKTIVEQACGRLGPAGDISCRHFFAGAAAYVDGWIFMTLTPVGLALKLGEEDRARLFRRGAEPLRYFPKAPVKKAYALLPARKIDDFDDLNDLIARSIDFVRK